MGDLKNQIFLQHVNKSLDEVRDYFTQKYTTKKNNRFFTKAITYELSSCRVESGQFVFEISSKIPHNLLPKRVSIEKYFDSVVKLVNKSSKKPNESKMENIIHNTSEEETKERDYVKLTYYYSEDELYNYEDVDKRLKHHQAKKIPIPDIPGVATPGGKIVIVLLEEAIANFAKQNLVDLINANEAVKKKLATSSSPKAKKKTAKK